LPLYVAQVLAQDGFDCGAAKRLLKGMAEHLQPESSQHYQETVRLLYRRELRQKPTESGLSSPRRRGGRDPGPALSLVAVTLLSTRRPGRRGASKRRRKRLRTLEPTGGLEPPTC